MSVIVRAVAERLQVEEDTARGIAATFLHFVAEQGPEEEVRQLFEQVPEARQLAAEGAEGAAAAAGGGLMGRLGGMLGGTAGAALSAIAVLKGHGLSNDQIRQAGRTLYDTLRKEGDPQLVRRIISGLAEKVPGMDKLL